MRFNLIAACLFLAGVAQATPVQDIFANNKAVILSKPVTIIDDYVFSVGRAKSSPKAGDEVGYSKAALIAYSNLDRLNFDQAEWPNDTTNDERSMAWRLYREANPFTLTIEGGQRIYRDCLQNEFFLIVMAFPKGYVLLPPVNGAILKPLIDNIRSEKDGLDAPVDSKATIDPIRDAIITPISSDSGANMTEVFDEELML